jgi:hypothetical protein
MRMVADSLQPLFLAALADNIAVAAINCVAFQNSGSASLLAEAFHASSIHHSIPASEPPAGGGIAGGAASLPEIEPQNCIVLHSLGLATLVGLAYTPLGSARRAGRRLE